MISFCAHLLRLPLDYFQRRSTGDILIRVSSIAMLRELLTAQTRPGSASSTGCTSGSTCHSASHVTLSGSLLVAGIRSR